MHVVEIMLTFDWGGRKISEEADCHFQNVRFFQLGVACVIFANKGQNQALQMIETVIDASSSSLLQQGFKSLQKIISTLLLGCTDRVNAEHISRNKTNSCVVVCLLLTFLSSLACFLWATVDLAGRGWLASVVKLGLILFAFSCCAFWREILASWAAELKCAAELASFLFMWSRSVRGEGTQAIAAGACDRGRGPWETSRDPVWTIWPPVSVCWYAEFRDAAAFYCI